MFLTVAGEDFRCRPLRFLLREVFVCRLLAPLVDTLTDPDFVNHFIVCLVSACLKSHGSQGGKRKFNVPLKLLESILTEGLVCCS